MESMNPKGVRERKLLENLRKCKDRLKLRKVKKEQAADVEMVDANNEESKTSS
jgi:hypothetical protein